jgi:hypothetical protein
MRTIVRLVPKAGTAALSGEEGGETALWTTLSEATEAVIDTGQAERALKKYDPDGLLFLAVTKPYGEPNDANDSGACIFSAAAHAQHAADYLNELQPKPESAAA